MTTLQNQLTQLEHAGLIALAKLMPELEYLFRHALVQDAAYASLLKADRRSLHRIVGETLAATYENRPEHAATLAHHFHQASDPERARHYYWSAGETALANYANREAEQHFRAALDLSTSDHQRLQAMRQLALALQLQSRGADALVILQEALPLAARLDDLDDLAYIYAAAAGARHYSDDRPGSLALCREGVAILDGAGDTAGLATLFERMASCCFFNGVSHEGVSYAQRAYEIAQRLKLIPLQADSLITLGMMMVVSDVYAAISYYEQAADFAETHRLWRPAARAHNNLASRHLLLSNYAAAYDHSRKSLDYAQLSANYNFQLMAISNGIEAALGLGEFDEAEQLLAMHNAIVQQGVRPAWAVLSSEGMRGEILCERGHWDEGLPIIQQWLEGARQSGDLFLIGGLADLLAKYLIQSGRSDAVIPLLEESAQIGDQGIGDGPLLPRCQLCAAFAAQGRLDDAHQTLNEAVRIASEKNFPSDSGDFLLARARLAAAEQLWQDASEMFAAALDWYTERRMRPAQAMILLEWAEVMRQMGRRDEASAKLDQALTIYETIGATGFVALTTQRISVLSSEAAV